MSLAFDTSRGVAVLFGGRDWMTGPNDETWEWNGGAWSLARPPVSPRPREAAAMAYDESLGRTILVGAGPADEMATWMWNGTSWSEYRIVSPSQFHGGAMAYDRARRRTVFLGGFTVDQPVPPTPWFGPTMELAGVAWIDRSTIPPAYPRERFGMAYVDGIGAVVFGGSDGFTNSEPRAFNDLWSWDGTTWQERL